MKLTFEEATPADIPLLTKTAFDSKSYWGYPREWMEIWREDLTVSDEFILENTMVKAFSEGRFVGFFILVDLGEKRWDLDAFWVVSNEIGKGFGRLMFNHVIDILKKEKAEILEVVADPNANGFYEKMGGVKTGKFPSKPKGRELDVFEIVVTQI